MVRRTYTEKGVLERLKAQNMMDKALTRRASRKEKAPMFGKERNVGADGI